MTWDVDDDGASWCTASAIMFHVESPSGRRIWTCRRSASNQQPRDSPSFTGREEDFQQWSKKTVAFFAGVIKESEMMLESAAAQATEITTTAIDLEFLPADTDVDREDCKTWSLCCSRCMQRSWLSRGMTRKMLSPTR